MNDAPVAGECWLLVGSQHLYGPETLAQVARQAQEVADQLDGAPEIGARIVLKPVLTDAEGIRRICLEASRDERCLGVIAWMHTFSPAKMWIAGLEALTVPLLHLHTQANAGLPWDRIDMDFMNLNQSAHGDREFGYICTRLGIRRKVIAGHVSQSQVRRRIGDWVAAARGWRHSQSLRIARFGDNMRDVAVTDGDRVEAQRRFGWSIQGHSINDLTERVAAVTDAELDSLLADYAEHYELTGGLAAGGERHAALREAARIEAGLTGFLGDGGFGAFTTNFQDLGALRQLPGLAPQRLMAAGLGFGAEGDWKTAGLLAVVKAMAAGRPGGTSFMEDYTYHLAPGEPRLLGAHMLEICPSISSERPRAEIHPLSIGDREDPVRLVFDADPGAGLVVGILDLGDRFRLVANEIELLAPDAPLPHLPVARALWRPAPDLLTSAECWITAGGPHHTVLSTAISREALDDLARIAGVELAWIDATSTPARFAQELAWTDATYR